MSRRNNRSRMNRVGNAADPMGALADFKRDMIKRDLRRGFIQVAPTDAELKALELAFLQKMRTDTVLEQG